MNIKIKAVGIDLGTTNSCVAIIDDNNEYVILLNEEDCGITPSCVAFTLDKNNNNLVSFIGDAAQRQAYANTKNTIYVFKRLMGKKFDEVQHIAKNVNYTIEGNENGDAVVNIFGQQKDPIFISSVFLRHLVQQIVKRSGYEVKDVVITVPANFDDAQRQATKQAGEIAGLNVIRIISEPTAAAMAYGIQNKDISGNVIVYDLGGGTFDVTILSIEDGFFNVKATGGDMNLGGEDFDNLIFEWILSEFTKIEGIKLTDNITLHRVKTEAKKAKELLSNSINVNINIPYVAPGPKHINLTITRKWFEEKIKQFVDKTIDIAKETLKSAGVTNSDIERGILVGGSTRIPCIKELLEEKLNIKFYCDISPDAAVAIGAAYQASVLSGQTKDIVLMDVTPLHIGIETVGGVMTPIINANTKIPADRSKMFTTARDNQKEVEIKIYQGNRATVADNKFLDQFKLTNIKPAPRGSARINVKFSIDSNGILNVAADEETSGVKHELSVKVTNSRSDETIQKMMKEAEEQKDRDAQALKDIEAGIECDNLVYHIEKQLDKVKDTNIRDTYQKDLATYKTDIQTDPHKALKNLQNLSTQLANEVAQNSSENVNEEQGEEKKDGSKDDNNNSNKSDGDKDANNNEKKD